MNMLRTRSLQLICSLQCFEIRMQTQWGAVHSMAVKQMNSRMHLNAGHLFMTGLTMFIVQHTKNNLYKKGLKPGLINTGTAER